MTATALINRVGNAYRRRAARWLRRRPFTIVPGRPIVSFTFDDFPRSALTVGGAILEEHGFNGTYYASLGLAGTQGVAGPFFRTDDLKPLLERGHELGCHTFAHCAAWETRPTDFEFSVVLNATALQMHVPSARLLTLSYPISYPRPSTKSRVSRRFACCRGGGQTFNTGTVDLNYLSSFFLEQNPDLGAIAQLIRANHQAGGWLIFSTHEISAHPTRFGCTPEFFRAVVQAVAISGAKVLPVHAAWNHLVTRASSPAS